MKLISLIFVTIWGALCLISTPAASKGVRAIGEWMIFDPDTPNKAHMYVSNGDATFTVSCSRRDNKIYTSKFFSPYKARTSTTPPIGDGKEAILKYEIGNYKEVFYGMTSNDWLVFFTKGHSIILDQALQDNQILKIDVGLGKAIFDVSGYAEAKKVLMQFCVN